MEFYTIYKNPRPVRLSESTRTFAYESLHHKYGKDTLKQIAVSLDHIEGIQKMSEMDKHDKICRTKTQKQMSCSDICFFL